MAEELKPCPFCSCTDIGEVTINQRLEQRHRRFKVYCKACQCRTSEHKTRKEARIYWNTRAQLPSQGGEAVEVVAYRGKDPDGGEGFVGARWPDAFGEDCIVERLMTVAQHQRILAASVGSGDPVAWREHSVNYAKGEKCPETIETLQAAWDRDQEMINDMRHEIARHKTRINRLEQRRPADQVARGVVVPMELPAWLDDKHALGEKLYSIGWRGLADAQYCGAERLLEELRALLEPKP